MTPSQKNTLYLIVSQKKFDAIIDGTETYVKREIKETNYKKYLETWEGKAEDRGIYFDENKISKEDAQKYANNPMVYNNGVYPYIPIAYRFLNLAVGYNEDRNNMTVTIKKINFSPMKGKYGKKARFSAEDGRMKIDENGDLCIWEIVYTLGKVLDAVL